MSLEENCSRLARLKELAEYHDNMSQLIGSEVAKLSQIIYNQCADSSTDQIRVSGTVFKDGQARIIAPVLKYRPSVHSQPELFTWLRATNNAEMIKETVHHATLESFVTAQKEANAPLPPEAILSVFTVETAKVRRAPKKAEKSA